MENQTWPNFRNLPCTTEGVILTPIVQFSQIFISFCYAIVYDVASITASLFYVKNELLISLVSQKRLFHGLHLLSKWLKNKDSLQSFCPLCVTYLKIWHKKTWKFQKNQWHKNFKRAFFALLGGRTLHAFREKFYYVNQKKVMLVQIETSNNLHILQHETA